MEETYINFSLGIVRIASGPIGWLNIRQVPEVPGYPIDYVVPDPKIYPEFPKVTIRPFRVFKGFRKVIDLRWEGKDFGLGIIDRLNGDISIRKPLMNSYPDLDVRVDPVHSCWVLSSSPTKRREFSVDMKRWPCYQVIAQHLLDTPISPR